MAARGGLSRLAVARGGPFLVPCRGVWWPLAPCGGTRRALAPDGLDDGIEEDFTEVNDGTKGGFSEANDSFCDGLCKCLDDGWTVDPNVGENDVNDDGPNDG